MSHYDEIASDLAEIFAEIGITISWNGADYQAVIADPLVQLDLQSGGFLPQADFAIKLRRTTLPAVPALGQTVTIQGVVYHITSVTDKPTSPLVILHVARA